MSENNAVVGYNSHAEAEATIKELQRSGFDMKKLSTCIPAHRSRSPQPVSADSNPCYERPSNALAEQFFAPVSLATVYPEAALMCAVLEDAFLCFRKQIEIERRRVRTAQEAEKWFFSDDSRGLFSFASICMLLELKPEFIRQGLKPWAQSHLDSPRKKR